jgi:hypothetical protein
VLAIVTGMLFVLSVAFWVIIDVAAPNVRAGARVLTPEGERLTRRARRRARKAARAASRAASAAGSLRDRLPEARSAPTRAEPPARGGSIIDLTVTDDEADGAVGRVEAGVAARTTRTRPSGRGTVPAQNGSPLATPAAAVSETISG